MFTARYGKGNKIGLTDKRTDKGRGNRKWAEVKPLREESLKKKKKTQQLKKWFISCTLCVWQILVMFIVLHHRKQTDRRFGNNIPCDSDTLRHDNYFRWTDRSAPNSVNTSSHIFGDGRQIGSPKRKFVSTQNLKERVYKNNSVSE